ncbi:MAG: Mut7-C RNAse domain-containing protein [Deltaproteobacteria bacterium]|nr:Mut7-C RNAse domain-containing protein [Deltaproteobacteria bacterium]
MRFVAEVMLGRLVKWLGVLGFDAHYQSFDPVQDIIKMAQQGRAPLTRQRKMIPLLKGAVFIRDNGLREQLAQLREPFLLESSAADWFSRCIRCNVVLINAPQGEARNNVPEYVFYEKMDSIRSCPSCGRYFWPGCHKIRMEKQLNEWGFVNPFLDLVTKS